MKNTAPERRGTVVALSICLLCVGLVFFNVACPTPPPPPPGCTSDEDCPTGQVCNTATEQCEPAPTGCTSDDHYEEGQFCDTETGNCEPNENLYELTRVDADYENRVHFEPSGHVSCTVCHHVADAEAGMPDASGQGCVPCHSDDPNEVNSFKSVAHDMNESNDGCRFCHSDEFSDNCKYCHYALNDL